MRPEASKSACFATTFVFHPVSTWFELCSRQSCESHKEFQMETCFLRESKNSFFSVPAFLSPPPPISASALIGSGTGKEEGWLGGRRGEKGGLGLLLLLLPFLRLPPLGAPKRGRKKKKGEEVGMPMRSCIHSGEGLSLLLLLPLCCLFLFSALGGQVNGKASGEKSRFKTLRACFGWGKDREGNLLKTFQKKSLSKAEGYTYCTRRCVFICGFSWIYRKVILIVKRSATITHCWLLKGMPQS